MDAPIEILDRHIARASARLREAMSALFHGEGSADAPPNPLAGDRAVSSQAIYVELAARGDVLGAAVRDWVYALTLERVLWDDTVRVASAWRSETIAIDHADLARERLSPRVVRARLLAETDGSRRRLLAEALERGAGKVADAARILDERRAEAARRLAADPDRVEIPCDPPGALARAADDLLRLTEPLAPRLAGRWHDALAASIGRERADGWPAHLTSRWIEELFRPTGLDAGLRLALGKLPAPLGVASFARALDAFGAALADADAPESAPFSLAHPPFDLRRARRAALFAGLVADPSFGARALGLGRGRARDQARAVSVALLRSLRLDAARARIRGALAHPPSERAQRFEEHTERALGAPIPASLAGVVPRLSPHDATRLAGAILAARDRRALVDRFDEDWFRSPHAARAIREEDGVLPASPRATAAALDAGVAEIVRTFEGLG